MMQWLGDWAHGLWNWVVIVLFLLLAAWETFRPARKQSTTVAPRWFTNIGLYAVNASLAAVFVPAAIVSALTGRFGTPPQPFPWLEGAVGEWWVLAAGILMLDLYEYLLHRVEHRVFLLWRFHAVHHADIDMDASTTLRHHPVEYLASSVVGAITFGVLGIPLWVFPVYALIGIAVSLVQHANGRLPPRLDRALRTLIVTPGMHHIHHSVATVDFNSNFGTVLSLWDRLFRTYRAAPAGALAFGVAPFTGPEHARPRWALLLPFSLHVD